MTLVYTQRGSNFFLPISDVNENLRGVSETKIGRALVSLPPGGFADVSVKTRSKHGGQSDIETSDNSLI